MLKKVAENIYDIPKKGKMRVPGRIFASDKLMENIEKDGKTVEQVQNVACLPGIVDKSIAMPDAHQGYGFPIGGVAAFDLKEGIVSPGGVGYDINCGVRVLGTDIKVEEFLKVREKVIEEIYKKIPSGVGGETGVKFSDSDLNSVLEDGIDWAVDKGYATKEDKERIEDYGKIGGAEAKYVSQRAKARGRKQLGTLGSGNHFLEIQKVEAIYDDKIAKLFGLQIGTVAIMIHSGSRGLGHQVASDYILAMEKEYGFKGLPDRELICAPINSKLGMEYLSAMSAAANFAFVNRQMMAYKIKEVFANFFPKKKVKLVYDIAHNIAKMEEHEINGKRKLVCVHRKGATRSFGPGRKELPEIYRKTGCPVFLPGSMGTYSYVLSGTKKAEEMTFGSTAHGAGRILSRSYAIKNITPQSVRKNLAKNGVSAKVGSEKGLSEEAPEAYKDINEVAKVSNDLGIGKLVARLKPLAVVKG